MNSDLINYLSHHLVSSSDAVLDEFVDQITRLLGDSVIAIVFYGSCLRTKQYDDAMLDFYVIVDDYKNCYASKLERLANLLLPPNVYFLQTDINQKQHVSKYAVIALKDLRQRVSINSFHPYFWARFCQPISVPYVNDEKTYKEICRIQAIAIETFLISTQKHQHLNINQDLDSEVWIHGFELTYAAELRAESEGRAKQIFDDNKDFYLGISRCLNSLNNQSLPKNTLCKRRHFDWCWRMRNILGRVLSILRLFKASFTFKNGVDYIAWKIERHTGEKILVSQRLRRFPWIFAWPILYKLLSKRTIK